MVVSMYERVMKFDLELSWPSFTSKNHKSTQKKKVPKFWGQNQVILGLFASLTSFRAKSYEILMGIFFSHIDNNKITQNVVGKVWVRNLVILSWFPASTDFRTKVMKFWTSRFLSILTGNYKNESKRILVCVGCKNK